MTSRFLTFPHRFALRADEMASDIYQVRQVHGSGVVDVSGDERVADVRAREADALVTRKPGVRIGVRTADCVPILIEDPVARSCAAVHAGWRGLLAGVIEAAVRSLGELPMSFRAALGPSIGPCCYEVGPEVAARFAEFVVAGDRPRVDLRAVARAALGRAGVESISDEAVPCTRCDPRGYYSYRRDGKDTELHLHFIEPPL